LGPISKLSVTPGLFSFVTFGQHQDEDPSVSLQLFDIEDSRPYTEVMVSTDDPRWLQFLSRRFRRLAIQNIAAVFVTVQAIGFLLIMSNPGWVRTLALIPSRVLRGEIWRVLTFLALPVSRSPIWLLIALYFEYFILNLIESTWGSFKTTFYFLMAAVLTIIFSLVFNYPVTGITDISTTFFLAAAALFPNFEIQIYFVIPVKMKYLGWLALGFLVLRFWHGSFIDRFYLATIYSNYLLFFGPSLIYRLKSWKRQRDFRAKWR
jgi:hypothetical protein